MSELYFDNSATTRVCPEAAAKALELMTECYGNPSSLHELGFRAEQELRAARRIVAQALGAREEEIVFTSGGTEGNNLALFGAARARGRLGKHLVTTAVEHSSVSAAADALEKEGFAVTRIEPDGEGHVSPASIRAAVRPDTILVSLMAVNNEVGTILPVEEAARAIAEQNAPALLHVDAVQAFGKLPLRPARMGADLMTVSAHKIHGPKGVGALYVKKGVHLTPLVFGGGQEGGLRPGTEPLPLIAAFGAAVRALPPTEEVLERMSSVNARLRQGLLRIPGVTLNSPADALPFILNFSAGHVRAETMLHHLASLGIYVSSGSACAKGKKSHVLSAMRLPADRIASALRVSLSRCSTQEEADAFLSALRGGMETLAH